MPPSRKSTSPAKTRTSGSGRAAASPAPAAKKATDSPAVAKRGSAKKEKATPAKPAEEEVKAAAAAPKNGNGKAAASSPAPPPAATPAVAKGGSSGVWIVALLIAVLGAIVGKDTLQPYVMPHVAKLQAYATSLMTGKKVPPAGTVFYLPAKYFEGKKLKGDYKGSGLIAFTLKAPNGECDACEGLKELYKDDALRAQHAEWIDASPPLRLGRVDCRSQDALCKRFGVETEDPSKMPKLVWFKDLEVQGEYSGDVTLEGLRKWYAENKESL